MSNRKSVASMRQNISIAPSDADDLRQKFHDLYGNGFDFEGETLAQLVIATGRFLTEVVGENAANAGMAALGRSLDIKIDDDAEWAEAIDHGSVDAYCWRMGVKLHDLNAFAYYGIALNHGATSAEREKLLREAIAEVESFMSRAPFELWEVAPGDAERTLRLARGRLELDTGGLVEPWVLAKFGKVSERRIRNMMAGAGRQFEPVDAKIPGKQALQWLRSRSDWRPSTWRRQNTFADLAPLTEAEEIEDVFFVPVAADGTVFHPGLRRNGVFVIDRGPRERIFESYEDALAALQRLAEPSWARPTQRGVWTHVTAAKWERMSRDELERRAADCNNED